MTTTDPSAVLAAIKARCEAATEGPWTDTGDGKVGLVGVVTIAEVKFYPKGNLPLIAHARTDVPLLADALQAVLDKHRANGHGYCEGCSGSTGLVLSPCADVRTITTALAKGETS